MAIGQFDLGPAAAFSIIYFLIILAVSFVFYTTIMHMQKDKTTIKIGG
jgi:glycerol transport system permease protein